MNICKNSERNKVKLRKIGRSKKRDVHLDRPVLRGELCMTFGTPQSGSQTTCMPIGVGLSYDELTLLSCDVHRSAQHVRLFDIQTGRLKHIISSTPVC